MEFFANGLHNVLSFILVISVIVFIHEFGHYFVAKLCGVKVEIFSIGFGKEICGFNDRSGTRWKFSMLPLGGYVKMAGDEGAASTPDFEKLEHLSEEERKFSFHCKPLWQKAVIVAAGPIANFILAIAIMTYFIYTGGVASTEPVIGSVMENTPAMEAGLQPEDRILTVDGVKMVEFDDIADKIATNLGTPVDIVLMRGSETLNLTITPRRIDDKDALGNTVSRFVIGMRSKQMTKMPTSFPAAVWEATVRTYKICELTMRVLGQIISGDRSATELKGPLGIGKMAGQATQTGDTTSETVHMVLWFIAMLSVNLGFVNLLPVPMLDGGHLVYYAVEAARGRPMAQKFQEWGFKVGFAMILCLMGFTIFNDIRQMIAL